MYIKIRRLMMTGLVVMLSWTLLFIGGLQSVTANDKTLGFLTFSGPKTHAEFVVRLVNEWGRKSGYKIKATVIPYNQLIDKMMISFVAKDPNVDFYYVDSGKLPLFTKGLYPLNDFIERDKVDLSGMSDSLIKTFTVDGNIYSIPIESDSCCLVYRSDLFNNPVEKNAFREKYGRELKPPKDFDELLEVAKFFARKKGETLKGDVLKDNLYGIGLSGRTYLSTTRFFHMFLHGFGGRTFDENLYPIFNNEAGQKALQFFVNMVLKHKVAAPGVLTIGAPEVDLLMKEGRIAMAPMYPHPVDIGAKLGLEFSSIAFYSVIEKAWGIGIAAHSKHKEALWDLSKFLYQKDTQLRFGLRSTGMGGEPTRMDVLTDPRLIEECPVLRAMVEVHNRALCQPQIRELPYVYDIQAEPIADVLTGKKSVKQALDDAVQRAYELLKKAGCYEGKPAPPSNIPRP